MAEEGVLSVDVRKVRDIGNAIGQSLDLNALRELGIVDENGELTEDITARQIITDDGTVKIDLPVAGD
jgi:hypothetical protein